MNGPDNPLSIGGMIPLFSGVSSATLVMIGGYLGLAVALVALFRLWRRAKADSRLDEQRCADAEQCFSLAFQYNTVPMCISDWDGTILDVNRIFCELFGYAPDDLLGKRSVDVGVWQRPEEQRTLMVDLLRQHGRVRNLEVEFRNKAGAVVPALLSVTLLTIDGQDRLLSSMHDLSAIKAMEEKNRKLEREMAQTKNLEAMAVLVGGLAHRFNNMLAAITGYAELALDDVSADSQTAVDLEQILVKAAEARQLVEQILSFSGNQPQQRQRIDLFGFVDDIVGELRASVAEGVSIETRLSGDSVGLHGDPAALRLAVLNICRNAVEAMPLGGVLVVGVQYPPGIGERFADVDADLPAGKYAHVFVKDPGRGMDRLTLERIFNPLFTTKEQGQGTGMGLSVAYGIVQAHDGVLRVNSRPGFGSTFHLFLPVIDGDNHART